MGVIKIILIIFAILIGLVIVAAVYLYFFHTFYTIRVCIAADSTDIKLPCTSNQECLTTFTNVSEIKTMMETSPDFMKLLIQQVLNKSIFCENTCKMRRAYGDGLNGVHVDSCQSGEQEVVYRIKGKDIVNSYSYIKNMKK